MSDSNNGEMIAMDDLLDYHPNKEEEAEYWNGIGSLTIFVTLVIPEENIFEYELLDYSGCMGGAQESLGIDYLLKDMWGVDKDPDLNLREGVEYRFIGITVKWTRGDGWTTDDDVDYLMGSVHTSFKLIPWFHTKMKALWWKHIGWRLKK